MFKKPKVSFFIEKAKRKKKLIIGLAVLLFLGFIFVRRPSGLLGEKEELKTTKVEQKALRDTVSASGKIEAENSAKLHFPTPAKVVWVGAKKGDTVKKWQSLASLDRRQLEKNLKKKLLDYMDERWDFEQTHDDYDIDGRPLDAVILTDAEKRIAEKAQFSLDKLVLDVEISDLVLKESVLVSPISGTVTEVEGMLAGDNLIAATLATSHIKVVDLSSLKFVAQVDEVDYGKIEVGQKVEIALDSFSDETFEGAVSYIGKEGVKTAGGGVTIPIEIDFNQNGNEFAVGLNGDVEFIVEEKEGVLVIPKEYVKTKNSDGIVYVLKDGKPEERKVKTGLTTLLQVEIIEGLTKDEEIVLVKNNKK